MFFKFPVIIYYSGAFFKSGFLIKNKRGFQSYAPFKCFNCQKKKKSSNIKDTPVSASVIEAVKTSGNGIDCLVQLYDIPKKF